ncbi:MAG TPA: TraB/GumN family protein [Kofleriaceae bacterium]|nr:TraB/GumN family protein [Kofleriaceae bacterium]
MSVTELVSGGTTFHVVGTAHVSAHSVDEVRQTIARLQPDAVCVELDQRRHDALTRDSAFRDLDVRGAVRDGRALYVLAQLALAAYQRRIGARLGIKPGAELLAAIDAARTAGIPVELIDRDIDITLKRTWRNLGLWRRITLFASLFVGGEPDDRHAGQPISPQMIEDLKQPRALSDMLTELGRAVPEIKRPLIDERDQYLASRLVEVGRGRRTVVAVVGAAHVPGICAQLGTPIDRAALEQVPPPSRLWRALLWLVPIAVAAALFHGGRSDPPQLVAMLRAWILPTALGAAGCTLLAGGSLWSAVASLAVAPVAALHPSLTTGMLVGRVEAWRRRPSLTDRERLGDDLQSVAGFRRNPVTRILLVAIASGVGTSLGFWVAVGWLIRLV